MNVSEVQSRMKALIEPYYLFNRVPVGEQTRQFTQALAAHTGASLLSFPSDQTCLTWVIPPDWHVNEAYLETLEGERIADFGWHPLYLKSYSAAFSGEVSRQELLNHVFTDQSRPDALVYDHRAQYQFGDRDNWGFSLPYRAVENLKDTHYRVHIDVEFSKGTMEVVDWMLPGELPDTVFFCAHTCHPGQVNDGIACIAVIVELFNWLAQQPHRRYSYRALFGPEYFTAAAMLAHGRGVEDLAFGFFLDNLALDEPMGFARSYRGNSYADQITKAILEQHTDNHIDRPYRGLWGNDELFYDGPGFSIPTLGLGRAPFPHSHTDKDNLENCDLASLEASLDLLKGIINVFETDCVPTRCYQGPLHLSRYDLYIDPKVDRQGYRSLQEIQIEMDGTQSCLQIAQKLGISYQFILEFVRKLSIHQLVTVKPFKSKVNQHSC